jgi:hypothetical protein
MNKRSLAKYTAKTVVMYATQKIVAETVRKISPKSQNLMVPEISGSIAGYIASEKLSAYTDQMVEDAFDKYESKKTN